MTPNERAAPEHLTVEQACAVMRQACQLGWSSTHNGNVSVAMTDRRGFLMSGSGLVEHALVPTQFVLIPAGEAPHVEQIPHPAGELELHRRLQALFNSQHLTVLHLHPTHTVAALYAGHRLAELSAGFPEVARDTRVGPNVAALPATGEERAEACAAAFRPALGAPPHIVGLERHGVVAVGKTPWEAFEHVERLEHICRTAVAASQPRAQAQGARHAHAR